MPSSSPRRGFRAVIAAAGFGLVATPLTLLPSTANAAPVDITLLNINDFHGRIDGNTVAFAATVEDERAKATGGAANTLFLSAGDNIGASLFASATADDQPTIDVLNALGMNASSVGNHEFDRGFQNFQDNVITGNAEHAPAEFSYLGANVYDAVTGEPVLDEYDTFEVGGVTVGVIGAVTEETPSLVSPGGIEGLEFGNPVEAVNRVAGELSDGDDTNGEADVIVAEFHEGAVQGDADSTLEENVARGGAFAEIVNETSAEVDAIFTGHTHMEYAYNEAPVPGSATDTRPIVQTGSYGENIGKITLTVEDTTGEVTAHTASNVPRMAPQDTDSDGEISDAEQAAFDAELEALVAGNPVLGEVRTIVDAALAAAEEIGKKPVGSVAEDITTAYATGSFVDGVWTQPDPANPSTGRDDRMSESTLGNLVADALRDTLASAERGGAQIGVVNPGGLRNELFYAGTPDPDTNADGVVTFAEANAVLPFVNNLWTVRLTGAQFKQVLEQQWQPEGSSRPFLHLGLSDNVSTTLDPSKPVGQRVTSVRVNGEPLDMDREYVIGTFSFLAQGGDNFTAFTEGISKDSGLIDREGWIEYLESHADLAPSFDRRQVYVSGAPKRVQPERNVSFKLERLNVTSLGAPENTAVRATLRRADGSFVRQLGSFDVTDGTADITVQVPAPTRAGWVVRLVARESGTTVTLPVVPRKATPAMRVGVRPDRIRDDVTRPRFRVALHEPGRTVHGKVRVRTHGDTKTLRLRDGVAVAKFAPYAKPGLKRVTVVYLGNDNFKRVREVLQVRVRR